MKKILAMVLVVALTAAVSIAGTMAYLTSTDSDVNVMTMGNVKIEQLEYERVVENGAWVSADTADKYGYIPDMLQPFTQAKSLLPAVFADGKIKWDDRNGSTAEDGTGHQQSWGQVGASGSNQLFDDSVKNVIDKFVFVKNTGSTNAYVRTWIALEQGKVAAEDFENVIMTNSNNNHWSWETAATDVEIGGNTYVVWCATYLGPKSNPTGILAPNTTSYPSLLQVYMRPEATNADVAAIDGNGNGTYDILVFSQAVQVEGFTNATTALTTAFGTNHPWTEANIPETVDNAEELNNALENGGDVILTSNITTTASSSGYGVADTVVNGGTLNGNGNTLSVEGTGDYTAVNTTGGTIENLNIDNGFRAVFLENMTEDVYLKNMNIGGEGVCYAINTGVNNGKYSLIVTDSKINGWSSFAQLKSASFTNCEFGQGGYTTGEDGRLLKPYVTTTVTDCTFIDNFYLDLSSLEAGCTVTLDGCTVNGVALTESIVTASSNWRDFEGKTFFVELPSDGRTLADCVIFK